MTRQYQRVICPACGARHKVPGNRDVFACLRCGTSIQVGSPPKAEAGGRVPCLLTPVGPYMLSKDREVVIGRGQEADVVLDSMKVSRAHTRVHFHDEAFYLTDLGSSNGTWVNDQRVSEHVLQDGDLIRIGQHEMLYRVLRNESEVREHAEDMMEQARSGQTRDLTGLVADVLRETEFRGRLETAPLAEICQMFKLNQRSGRLTLVGGDGRKGLVWFRKGQILRAECRGVSGEKAVHVMFGFKQGTFRFEEGTFTAQQNVDKDTERILLDAARLEDEGG